MVSEVTVHTMPIPLCSSLGKTFLPLTIFLHTVAYITGPISFLGSIFLTLVLKSGTPNLGHKAPVHVLHFHPSHVAWQ